MKLVAGCPIAHRAWALPEWFDRLARQTRRPDSLLFIHSGQRDDATWTALHALAGEHDLPVLVVHEQGPTHRRHDNERFHTLARLRNELLSLALYQGADVFLSLDSDVMLDDERTVERLLGHLNAGWDLASPLLYLHPHQGESWAWNAGWWQSTTKLIHEDDAEVTLHLDRQGTSALRGDPRRGWYRGDRENIAWGLVEPIDIPMAAIAMNRRVLRYCRYRWHESGEDLGFAQDLERINARAAWDTGLRARHVWDETQLAAAA
jgi:hypothetical protein